MSGATFNSWADNIKTTQCLASVTLTGNGTTTNCTSVDTTGFGATQFEVNVGNSGDTLSGSVYMEIEMQESTDNSTFTAVADADVDSTVTANNTGTLALIDAPTEDTLIVKGQYLGTKRYVRIAIVRTGNHANGTPMGVAAHQWRANVGPVA